MDLNTDKQLWRVAEEEYGAELYRSHLLDQYKLYVQTAERISTSRTAANNYLLTVNAFLVTLYGLLSTSIEVNAWVVVVPIAGMLICLTWSLLIQSYRKLNTAKFKVIHELEERLPAALFDREWDFCERGEGRAYKPFTHIEPYIPMIFAVLYLILVIFAVAKCV